MTADAAPRLRSLSARGAALAAPAAQLARLDALAISGGEFAARLVDAGWPALSPVAPRVLQLNIGRMCNMTCRHCHVDAGPDRTERMSRETLEACVAAIGPLGVTTVDITGGAPELHPDFRWLVDACVARGVHVIDRCNLTVLLLPQHADLPAWLAARGVEVVASLPAARRTGTDAQRGDGTFDRSLDALRRLNGVGYGLGDPQRILTLVHNPPGAFLPGGQASLERDWKRSLARDHGVSFDRLIALNNMPVARFLEWLDDTGNTDAYVARLVDAFNPAAVAGLMCRDTVSVGWDGTLYDCDFNQLLDLPCDVPSPRITDVDPAALARRAVVTRRHCFGCTAGAGSSCGGATAG